MNKTNRGFSMIEILITLVLICIGVLGMVAMQGRTIQYTQDSVQRNVAAALANDLIELMRAMPQGLPDSSDFYKAKDSAFTAATDAECKTTPDTPAKQLACWQNKVVKSLPGASSLAKEMYICRSKTPNVCANEGSAVEIQLAWSVKKGECLDGNPDAAVCYYRLRTQL
ncbi:type IV pilus modification protein PilV [Pseudomonas sp. RIT-PI-AD]|uniref:type IV pilus modification protein PilV n=1 Tax=Pseudomonas sp. RIT-PI-AD TaxID=3035294 RepID=UPI0021D9116E|nr:type IV pilus modification protein PilV [Pseudomonas sp. RIT-PI-AD]